MSSGGLYTACKVFSKQLVIVMWDMLREVHERA